eukprot:snap_masked-scaffold_53-processed-gene-0.12-mRNA-1 protein AED:1.00 eAED:1.00 QI:0/0/0/0/1/1/4/0/83
MSDQIFLHVLSIFSHTVLSNNVPGKLRCRATSAAAIPLSATPSCKLLYCFYLMIAVIFVSYDENVLRSFQIKLNVNFKRAIFV